MTRLSVRPRLAALGLEPSPAPNSLWLKNPAVDKSLPVHYMVRHADRFGFDLASAVAFGDNPAGERPQTTRLPPRSLRFPHGANFFHFVVDFLRPILERRCCWSDLISLAV